MLGQNRAQMRMMVLHRDTGNAPLARIARRKKLRMQVMSGDLRRGMKQPLEALGLGAESLIRRDMLQIADMRPGDVVIVKGSFGSRMSLVVEALKRRALETAAE